MTTGQGTTHEVSAAVPGTRSWRRLIGAGSVVTALVLAGVALLVVREPDVDRSTDWDVTGVEFPDLEISSGQFEVVANGSISVLAVDAQSESPGDATPFGVIRFDSASDESEFFEIGTQIDCETETTVWRGGAGFLLHRMHAPADECEGLSTIAISADGSEWDLLDEPWRDGFGVVTNDGFRFVDAEGVHDLRTGELVHVAPWAPDDSLEWALPFDDGSMTILGADADVDPKPFGNTPTAWILSEDGRWSTTETSFPERNPRASGGIDDSDYPFLERDLAPRIERLGDGYLAVPWLDNLYGFGLMSSTDGVTWSSVDDGIGEGALGRHELRFTSPERSLVVFEPEYGPACLATTSACDIPDEITLEVTPDGVTELDAFTPPGGRAQWISIDEDGRYRSATRKPGTSTIEIVEMPERIGAHERAIFDRDALPLVPATDDALLRITDYRTGTLVGVYALAP